MLLEHLERSVDLKALKKDFRKIGVNFITAGIVGIFINHYVGIDFSKMFWASLSITTLGMFSLTLGLLRRNK